VPVTEVPLQQDAGAVVLGISSDSPDVNAGFAKEQRLPFPLLTDQVCGHTLEFNHYHACAVTHQSAFALRGSDVVLPRMQGEFLRKSFGIKADLFGALPGRQTFVIDKSGVCRLSFNNQFQPEKHIQEALDVIKTL
jgi:peroxiredoxin Q/BCP